MASDISLLSDILRRAAVALSVSEHAPDTHTGAEPLWVFPYKIPKGLHPAMLDHILHHLHDKTKSWDSTSLSVETGISASGLRRYLNYLLEAGMVQRELEYTSVGRPAYKWRPVF